MKNKKRKNTMMLIIILVLAISIGFAALATTLKIIGTTSISKNTWNIYWDNAVVTTGSVTNTPPVIGQKNDEPARTRATWEVNFNQPGDFYEFTIDAVNAGTIDAAITKIDSKIGNSSIISTNTETGELVTANPSPVPPYIKYSIKYADGTDLALNDSLPKTDYSQNPVVLTTRKYRVRVEFDKNAVTVDDINDMEEDLSYEFTFEVTYGQAKATPQQQPDIDIDRHVPGEVTPGDKVCIGQTECFYVISTNNDTTDMVSKYNLLVGNRVENGVTTPIDTTGAGYNIQSPDAKGYDGSDLRNAVVPFATGPSGYGYWWDNTNYMLKPQYNGDTSGNPFYPRIYDSNSTTHSYVEEYVRILKEDFNMPASIEGRLLYYEEAHNSESLVDEDNNPIIVNRDTSYWMGSAHSSNSIWVYSMYSSSSMIDYLGYNNDDVCGIRPVIEIPTSLLN